jgi:dUTP pyrophosphatase
MKAPVVELLRLRPDAQPPRYMSAAAAGGDLSAAIDEPVVVDPGQRVAIGTGLAMAIQPGYEAQVRPRSGLAWKKGLTVVNAPGTIDADYRGEVKVLLVNLGSESVTIEPGDRIAQIVIAPAIQAHFQVVDALPGSERGEGGFGSTGHARSGE